MVSSGFNRVSTVLTLLNAYHRNVFNLLKIVVYFLQTVMTYHLCVRFMLLVPNVDLINSFDNVVKKRVDYAVRVTMMYTFLCYNKLSRGKYHLKTTKHHLNCNLAVNITSGLTVKCTGGSKSQIENCCSSSEPCKVSQGDCDRDSECEGSLVCGKNNCGRAFSWEWADCCEPPAITNSE